MKVKELIERLQTLDPNFEVYITNAEETQLTGIDVVIPCEDFGKDDREEFVAIFPKDNPQPLFTLTPEEVKKAERLFIVAKKWGQFMYEDDIKKGHAQDALLSLSIARNADKFINRIKQWQEKF